MAKHSQFLFAPIRALQPQTTVSARWVLIDPNLRADCISAYRSLCLLFFTLFALVASPLRAETTANQLVSCEIAPLLPDAEGRHMRLCRAVQRSLVHFRFRRKYKVLKCRIRSLIRKQQLACLEISRAHAPPVREIPDETFQRSLFLLCSAPVFTSLFLLGIFASLLIFTYRFSIRYQLHPFLFFLTPVFALNAPQAGFIAPAVLLSASRLQLAKLPPNKGETNVCG